MMSGRGTPIRSAMEPKDGGTSAQPGGLGPRPVGTDGPVRVGFVIPCFNHGRFIAEAARSCLEQEGMVDGRVVVVDDGSNDGSTPQACDACAALDPARVSVLHQQNRGLPAARNRGAWELLGIATGVGQGVSSVPAHQPEYLVFLDADDWIRPGFVVTLHAALAQQGERDMSGMFPVSHAYCQEELVGLGHGVWRVPAWDRELLMITNLHPVTCLVRAENFRAVGGFDERMRLGYEDWDLWLRFASRGWAGARVAEPMFVWRRHSEQTMVNDAVARHEQLYAQLVRNHPSLFAERLEALLVRTNGLLRKFDMNWLDETGLPRELQYLRWARDRMYELEREAAQAESAKEAQQHRPGRLRTLLRALRGG